jgi:hypothetical protein
MFSPVVSSLNGSYWELGCSSPVQRLQLKLDQRCTKLIQGYLLPLLARPSFFPIGIETHTLLLAAPLTATASPSPLLRLFISVLSSCSFQDAAGRSEVVSSILKIVSAMADEPLLAPIFVMSVATKTDNLKGVDEGSDQGSHVLQLLSELDRQATLFRHLARKGKSNLTELDEETRKSYTLAQEVSAAYKKVKTAVDTWHEVTLKGLTKMKVGP